MSKSGCRVVDEFLRIRLILDEADTVEDEREFEDLIIAGKPGRREEDEYEE